MGAHETRGGAGERTVVIALGGNALSPASEEGTIAQQFRHTRESLGEVVELAQAGWRIAMVHGNGPQVGNALTRNEMAKDVVPPLPLGVLVAATQGWIGYMVQQSLQNGLAAAGVNRAVVTLITQVVVDRADPSFASPSKPVGRVMDEATARERAATRGWKVAEGANGWRRVVPSPRPLEIVEREMIQALVASGHLVIAAGGGGTPVYSDPAKRWEGLDAVIDKDRAAAVLGHDIGADLLLILTDVEGVYTGFGTAEQRLLPRLAAADAAALFAAGEFGAGSMAPKVEAAVAFVRGGGRAVIARLDQAHAAVAGDRGTEIVAG